MNSSLAPEFWNRFNRLPASVQVFRTIRRYTRGRTIPVALLSISLTLQFIAPAGASELRTKFRSRHVSCPALCAELGNLIRQDPDKLVMGLEDALVVSESCTREIIAVAIDAVNADPHRVRLIYEAAIKVVPHRKDEIARAIRQFSVPAARPMREPVVEVRRAKLPDSIPVAGGNDAGIPVLEVRRAQAPGSSGDVPIAEIRRAVVPAK